MEVRRYEILIRQVHSRWRHRASNHLSLIAREILVAGVALAARRQTESRTVAFVPPKHIGLDLDPVVEVVDSGWREDVAAQSSSDSPDQILDLVFGQVARDVPGSPGANVATHGRTKAKPHRRQVVASV